jgi:hypothetical protein
MSKNYERDEREEYWRRPQQNRESQERWSGSGREDDYGWGAQQGQEGRDWRRNEEYERRRWQEMKGRDRGEGEYGGWEGGRGRQWGNEDYDYGRERHYGTQGRNWPGSRGESNRGWEGGQRNWGIGRQGWQGGGEWQGRGWEPDYGNDQPYGRDFGREWDERSGGMSREYYGRGGMTGMRGGREDQWEGGWNQGMGRGQGRHDRGMESSHTGRGPRSYKRSDNRIEEDINERLTQHSMLDATDIEVNVQNGEVTLRGHVDHREAKRLAEDIVENVFGVKDVNNQIKVRQRGEGEEGKHEGETSGKRERKAS